MRQIKKHSKIAIISPSSGLTDLFPHIYRLGLDNLEKYLELEYVEFPTTKLSNRELYEHPELRAKDINDAFADTTIDGIITTIGGYESVRILKYLDLDIIINNPKLIMGFSDSTSFLSFFSYLGMTSFYGPSIMAGFAQCHHFDMSGYWKQFMMERWSSFSFPTTKAYVSGYIDWNKVDQAGAIKEIETLQAYNVETPLKGKVWGGCIEVLEMLKGTKYFPDVAFFKDKILFFETSEEMPLPMHVGYMLRNYGTIGVLNEIKGIVFGRCYGYNDQMLSELQQIVSDIINLELKLNVDVIYGINSGHTDPQWILPFGVEVEFNKDGMTILENPWSV